MAQAKGSAAQLIYDVETAFNSTPGSPDAKKLNIVSEGLALSRNYTSSQIIRNNRNAVKPKRGLLSTGGPIVTELSPYMATILKHLLGANTTTGANPYTHTMKVGALPVSLCFEKGFTDIAQYFLHNGCRIKKGDFEFRPEGVVPLSLEILGSGKETVAGASFDATPTDLGHDPWDAAEMAILEGGGAIANVSSVKLSIENELDDGLYVIGGNGLRRAIPEGTTLVSGVLTALFEDVTLYNKAVNYTESSLKITLSRGTGLGSAGNESLETLVPELIYKPKTPPISGPKGIVVELEFAGYYENAAEASSVQMILKNTQAAI